MDELLTLDQIKFEHLVLASQMGKVVVGFEEFLRENFVQIYDNNSGNFLGWERSVNTRYRQVIVD